MKIDFNYMFSGIISHLGKVADIQKKDENSVLKINTKNSFLKDTEIGESIAVNGVCTTVTNIDSDTFSVDIMPETLRLTNLFDLNVEDTINLEKSLKIGDRISGHFVSGHVDSCEEVLSFTKTDDGKILTISLNEKINKYVPLKGSITINGVSLTVMDVDEKSCSIALIPHTLEETNLGKLEKSDKVNVEVDMIARYLEKINK